MRQSITAFVTIMAALVAQPSRATEIVGGSSLLSSSDAAQLEAWLGEGPITLTNIFSKTTGDGKTSADFHAAVDGNGRTFSVIQVLAGTYSGQSSGGASNFDFAGQIIGGYNPQSWSSVNNYNFAPADADRTAFLFNLTSTVQQNEHLNPIGAGQYQTYNASNYGPIFGGGFDLSVAGDLSGGTANTYTYGSAADGQNILFPAVNYSTTGLNYGTIEVFTMARSSVPEPSTLILLSAFTAFASLAWWRRRRAA